MQKDNLACWPFFSEPHKGMKYKNDDFSIAITEVWYKNIHWQEQPHRWLPYYAKAWQLRMQLSGESTLAFDNNDVLLMKAGEFIILPEGVGFHILNEPHTLTKCGVDFRLLPSKKKNSSIWSNFSYMLETVVPYRYSHNAAQLFNQILQLQKNPGFDYETNLLFLTMSLLMDLLNTVVNALDETLPKSEIRVQKAMHYIRQAISADTTAECVAEYIGISARHLNRLFVAEADETLGNYISNIRRQKLCSLLQDEQLTLREIASMMNYHDTASFFRAFKRLEGVSPHQYRRALKIEEPE